MARPNPLRAALEAPLPSITYQKRKSFRINDEDVKYAYKIINRYVFDNELRKPNVILGRTRLYWGMCIGHSFMQDSGSFCTIKLTDKFYSVHWFLNTLAHEMAHQYQWDVITPERLAEGRPPIISHGPTFFMWKERMAYYGLTLKTAHSMHRWFKHQEFSKC